MHSDIVNWQLALACAPSKKSLNFLDQTGEERDEQFESRRVLKPEIRGERGAPLQGQVGQGDQVRVQRRVQI